MALTAKVQNLFLPKLRRNLEECDIHPEFAERDKNLTEYFSDVINLLSDSEKCNLSSTVLSSFTLLYYDLTSDGRWNTDECYECGKKLDSHFQLKYDMSLLNLLKNNKLCKAQDVFNKSMEILHKKLTPEDFKKYPALIDAYCSIIRDINDYDVVLNPVYIMPVALLLIEDFLNENRLKGLKSCSSILRSLTQEHFKDGNYYEVVYQVLKKTIVERDLEITKLVLECILSLLKLLPLHARVTKVDDTLNNILDQMYTESNLYRKKAFFSFINEIIHSHGVHCVKRNMFLPIICDNLDICSNVAVGEVLLLDVIQCLENWIRYCWCVWKLPPNKKLVSLLIRTLYTESQHEHVHVAVKIQNILIALGKLCTVDEQKEICNNIDKLMLNEDVKLNNQYIPMLNNILTNLV